jgi:hypothetical protein
VAEHLAALVVLVVVEAHLVARELQILAAAEQVLTQAQVARVVQA